MSDRIERPTFFEGQVLAAADLKLSVDAARARAARHERYLHMWGIVAGLALTGSDRKTKGPAGVDVPYKAVVVSRGVAIDGTGREIVVPADDPLIPAAFDEMNLTNGQGDDAWYPVFLVGRDEDAPLPRITIGACDHGASTRTREDFLITFGRPGDEAELENQVTFEVGDGPGDGATGDGRQGWRILLGYVQWDRDITQFKGVDVARGIRPRFAGVQADEIASRSDSLTIRTGVERKAGNPAVRLSEADGGTLTFGVQGAGGAVTSVFTVNAKGDVEAKGKITGQIAGAAVYVRCGSISNGMALPLPAGVTAENVAKGQITLHMHVTPRFPGAPAPAATELLVPIVCTVDPDTRVVSCSFRRWTIGAAANTAVDEPGACDFTIVGAA